MRDQYFRQPRRRDFDDAAASRFQAGVHRSQPRLNGTSFEAPSGPPVRGVVKWFNPEKGFGFIQLSDGSGDAFLHLTVLAQSGFNIVQPGATLEVRVGPGHKGPHVTEVLSVDPGTVISAPGRPNVPRATSSRSEIAVEQAGTVKWFNADKGYGFIALADEENDVFIHVSALERSGLTALVAGQQVVVDIGEGRKGPEALKVRLT